MPNFIEISCNRLLVNGTLKTMAKVSTEFLCMIFQNVKIDFTLCIFLRYVPLSMAYIYIIYKLYAIMKTMCPPCYHHNGFVATHALGHMMYGFSHH